MSVVPLEAGTPELLAQAFALTRRTRSVPSEAIGALMGQINCHLRGMRERHGDLDRIVATFGDRERTLAVVELRELRFDMGLLCDAYQRLALVQRGDAIAAKPTTLATYRGTARPKGAAEQSADTGA